MLDDRGLQDVDLTLGCCKISVDCGRSVLLVSQLRGLLSEDHEDDEALLQNIHRRLWGQERHTLRRAAARKLWNVGDQRCLSVSCGDGSRGIMNMTRMGCTAQ